MVKRQEFEKIIKTGKSLYAIILDRVSKLDRHNTLIYSNAITDMCFNEIDFNKVYKTQSEAEWVAKMHTQRTEFFEPPIYEEWLKREIFEFCSKDHKNYAISVCLEFDFFESPAKDYIEITNLNDFDHHKLFCAEKTKDNYIKACEFARNLFIGKENDNETDSDR